MHTRLWMLPKVLCIDARLVSEPEALTPMMQIMQTDHIPLKMDSVPPVMHSNRLLKIKKAIMKLTMPESYTGLPDW